MLVKEKKLKGVFEIIFEPQLDHRGYFMRTYDKEIFNIHGIDRIWVQENHSLSRQNNTIRGLHFQLPPYTETKLIRVIKGTILDVFVDLRQSSATFGKWDAVKLSSQNNNMILIPRGFAHGFCTLDDNCEVLYKTDNYYKPEHESGIIWNDQTLNIPWPTKNPIISEKDKKLQSFQDFVDIIDSLPAN